MRVGLDLVFPRPPARGPIGDRAFGPLIAHKLGHGVVDALVDPLMGGIHAGGVADMSTAAVNPLLLAVAQERGSFMRSLRQAAARQSTEAVEHSDEGENEEAQDTSSVFWSLTGGVASLGSAVSDVLRTRGVELRTECAVDALATNPRHRSPWVIETRGGPVVVDGVVVALPAGPAATLLGPHDSDAATLLGGIDYASVAVVTLWYPPGALTEDLEGTGMLVPRSTTVPGSPADGPLLVTAVSYLENKWPHLRRDGGVLLRASVGRLGDERFTTMDDEELVARVGGELSVLIGTEGPPSESMVTRWPASFPQYRVHHLLRVAGIESAVKRLPALAVAGAAYRGVGIPACITSGRQAAHEVRDALAGAVGVGPMQ
jgi:oxygen-dependent protoporphyrinogen oxidase